MEKAKQKFEEMKEKFPHISLFFHEPLKKYTFTKVGGPADVLVFPKNVEEMKEILIYAQREQMNWLVLGNASNLIVRDGGIRGIVFMLTQMNDITVDPKHATITAQAGVSLIETCKIAKNASLTGLEFACGIPGSVGGAVYMNAGAYGGEIKDCLKSCQVLTEKGEILTLTNEALHFSYRHSCIQETNHIVLSATFSLETGVLDEIEQKMNELTQKREAKQPLEFPSCGSVFKRPEGYYTGALIREAGLQGYQIGGVQVSTKHAGFIVNIADGTAKDYEELIQHIIQVVREKNHVTLQPEVRIIGEYEDS